MCLYQLAFDVVAVHVAGLDAPKDQAEEVEDTQGHEDTEVALRLFRGRSSRDDAHGSSMAAAGAWTAEMDSSTAHSAMCVVSRDARVESMTIRRSGRCGNPSSTSFPLYI